jgi:two-component system, cell cycle sensor histidine kinase and response regulator CckA
MTPTPKPPDRTILVVENSAIVLNTVRRILENADFAVLPAASADEAMRLMGSTKKIHLLLTAVMLPEMSGSDLALQLKALRPEMRVMLMSGYPNGEMLVLNYGWYFIEKPFVAVQLVAKINEILDDEMRDQSTDHFDTRKVKAGCA